MHSAPRTLTFAGSVALLSLPLFANDPIDVKPLILEGDSVPGVGLVTRIDNMAVNNSGIWLVEIDTDNADTNIDQLLLRRGQLFHQQSEVLSNPVGATLSSFDAIEINNLSNSGVNVFLDNTAGSNDDSGIYFLNKNTTALVLQEGAISTASGFSASTPYIGFFESKSNDSNIILVVASVDDSAIASTVDRALVELAVDGSGTLLSETVRYIEEQILPGQTEMVADFGTGPHNFAYNNNGDILFFADLTGSTTTDGVIYLSNTLIAQEGSPSPVGGRNWSSLSSPELDLSNASDFVFSGSLDGDAATNLLIVKNGNKFRQEGDTLPAISPFLLTSFGTAPLLVNENGDVLWFGDWDDPDTTKDTGIFLNDTLLVQEGVTTVNGIVIQSIASVQDAMAMSDDGSIILFEATLSDGREGVFMIGTPSCVMVMSDCFSPPGVLSHTSGTADLGDTLVVSMDNGQSTSGVLPILNLSTAPDPNWPPCGTNVLGFGEVLIDVLPPNPILTKFGALWTGSPVPFNIPVPCDPFLNGLKLYIQGTFVDFVPFTAETYRQTNGLEVELGT